MNNSMVDFKGQELNIGDRVIYIHKTIGAQASRLAEGEIVSFPTKSLAQINACKSFYTSDTKGLAVHPVRVKSQSIMKI